MAIHYKTLPAGTPIYTWIDDKTGENWHIYVPGLREWIKKREKSSRPLKVQYAPVDYDFAMTFIRDNSVDFGRVLQLGMECYEGKRLLDPIILCCRGTYTNGGPDVMLADGHHRYVLAALVGQPTAPCYLLELSQWKKFRVVGAPVMTQDQLIETPLTKRNY